MPVKRQCTTPLCPQYAVDGHSKCIEHKKEYVKESFGKIKRTHSLYNTTAWQRLRAQHKRANPFCIECGKPGTDVDHKKKHKGDWAIFFDPNNLQTMCKKCHNRKTGRGE
jgi:5-methylcytosine-specific restriction protein A